MTPVLTDATRSKIRDLMARYPQPRSALGPALEAVQQQLGYVPEEAMAEVAALFDIDPAEVRAFVGFYHMLHQEPLGTYHIEVCTNVPCLLRGAGQCAERLKQRLGVDFHQTTADGLFTLGEMECLGSCATAPMVAVTKRQANWMRYYEQLDTLERIDAMLDELRRLADLPAEQMPAPARAVPGGDAPRASGPYHHDHHPETNFLLARIDKPDSHTIESYEADGGYQTARRALTELTPTDVLETVKASGLRGRGGAGFPTGVKWGFLPKGVYPRYLVVNADESEPGTFKDRLIIEYDPHHLIEGIILAAYATEAEHAFIYIRGEYFFGAQRLEQAIAEARAKGYVGKGIFGTKKNLEIVVHRGAGAYICGEETALLTSLEGYRGHPRLKPPFPAVEGLYRKPTIVNNVETITQVVPIVKHGAQWYRQWGTEKSPGFALYCLSGNVKKPGVYELPYNTTLRQLIYDYAGGTIDDRPIKSIIPGGLSMPHLPADKLDTPMDFESIAAAGSLLGSCGIIVVCEGANIVELARRTLTFFRVESCGKCTPCREGSGWLEKILGRIEAGHGQISDLDLIERLTYPIERQSFCPFGPASVWGVRSLLKLFRAEFEEYIRQTNPNGKGPELPVRPIYRPDTGQVAPKVRV
ncbi:MAG: NADH-quinone oxidoreductase subunit NuoF [Caldilineales bacterium]|nr:NADH-quinone oxidoreductase subunit NuoF [Caldilineales bacterium]